MAVGMVTWIIQSPRTPTRLDRIRMIISFRSTQTPALTLDKTVAESSYDSVGDILTYSYKLTNSGNVTLAAPYSVDDDKTTVTCPATPATLAPLAFVTCSATYAVTQADIDAGFVTNVAMGHGMWGEIEIDSNQTAPR